MTTPANDMMMEDYFSGRRLYGDDFSADEIDAWFADEAEGYYTLKSSETKAYAYEYHALNRRHGYSGLPRRRYGHVLGIGSAYGDELQPVLAHSDRISILEPSEGFRNATLEGVPVTYAKPVPAGDIPFDDASVDLITCFGVLHHIPNVTKVVNEFHRVLAPGGFALIREPIISMGDWRRPRPGLTRRERGIPLAILRRIVEQAGFRIVRERRCMFSLTSRLKPLLPGPVFNNGPAVALDALLSSLPVWPGTYHARSALEKFRPTAVFYVLQKLPAQGGAA